MTPINYIMYTCEFSRIITSGSPVSDITCKRKSCTGVARIGFPLVFMQDTEGKCVNCQSWKWFNIHWLIADLFFWLLNSVIIWSTTKFADGKFVNQ